MQCCNLTNSKYDFSCKNSPMHYYYTYILAVGDYVNAERKYKVVDNII